MEAKQDRRYRGDSMETLRALDFAIVETVLYLDAYPESKEALAYYHTLLGERAQVAAQYEKQHGPLTVLDNESATAWEWIQTPWPWEYGAEG